MTTAGGGIDGINFIIIQVGYLYRWNIHIFIFDRCAFRSIQDNIIVNIAVNFLVIQADDGD